MFFNRTKVWGLLLLLFMSSVFFALHTNAQGNGEFSVYLPLTSASKNFLEEYRGAFFLPGTIVTAHPDGSDLQRIGEGA